MLSIILNSGGRLRTNTLVRGYSSYRKLSIGVQGAGFGGGQTKEGLECGPDLIRRSGFQKFLSDEVGHSCHDYGNIPFETNGSEPQTIIKGCVPINNARKVADANLKIYKSTLQIFQDGRLPLTLGGDHSISIGTMNAVSEFYSGSNLGVVWVDAHLDLNTPYTTSSGNIHGFPVAFALSELKSRMQALPQFNWVNPRLQANQVVYLGLREFGGKFNPQAQRDTMKQLGMKAFTMADVDAFGIQKVSEMALDHLGKDTSIHLSFDVDSMDDREVGRCTGTAVSGGLTLRESLTLLEKLSLSNIVSVDLVEVNPKLGDDYEQERIANVCKHLIGAMFGYKRAGI